MRGRRRGLGRTRRGYGAPMADAHAQDETTFDDHDPEHDPVTPPAPANQWTPHDGGVEPAAPAPDAAATALRRMGRAIGRLFRRS